MDCRVVMDEDLIKSATDVRPRKSGDEACRERNVENSGMEVHVDLSRVAYIRLICTVM